MIALAASTPSQERERQRTLYNQIQQLAFPLLNARQQDWTTALFESFLVEGPDWHFEPVIIHGDLDSTNILCQQTSGTLTGILDFEEARLGDAAWDFCALKVECGWLDASTSELREEPGFPA
jgi:aminoglycoside 2''-phosphotransferase